MAYIQSAVMPVQTDRETYRRACAKFAALYREYGAEKVVDAWGVDVPDGVDTDFRKAVKAEKGETIAVSFIYWPDRATCDAANAKLREDPRMAPAEGFPFDLHRMIYGGFDIVHGA